MQVRKHYCKCFRSDNPCIIVLPCPRLLCSCVYELASCLTELLLLAGDVETNPGPKTDELLQKLELIAGDIKEIKEDRLTSIDKKLENLDVLATKISSCVEQVAHLQEVVSALELKVDDLENRSRRCNLIIYGIPENQNEDNSTLEETVTETVFKEKLEIDGVGIERIHRLGKPAANKTRPIILKLHDFRDKTRVFKNCHKLKGTDLSVSEDFSVRVRDIRRNLWNCAKANKESGDKVSLAYDKLRINKVWYQWDEAKKDKVAVRTDSSASSIEKKQQVEAPALRPRRPNQPAKP